MHMLLLVWKHSRYYNTPPCLAVIMCEICNDLVEQVLCLGVGLGLGSSRRGHLRLHPYLHLHLRLHLRLRLRLHLRLHLHLREPATQVLEDISSDHALKTVTLEAHPHTSHGAGLHA